MESLRTTSDSGESSCTVQQRRASCKARMGIALRRLTLSCLCTLRSFAWIAWLPGALWFGKSSVQSSFDKADCVPLVRAVTKRISDRRCERPAEIQTVQSQNPKSSFRFVLSRRSHNASESAERLYPLIELHGEGPLTARFGIFAGWRALSCLFRPPRIWRIIAPSLLC